MKAKKINARSKELENAMKELYSIKDGGVPPELAIQEAETLIETIEHQEAEINYLHDIMIKRGEQMVYEEMYNDMKKLADKQEKEIERLEARKYMLNAETGEISQIPLNNNYISKDKIRAKIEELEKEQENNRKSLYNAINILYFKEIDKISNRISVNMAVIDILQSLLEEEKR